MAPAIKELSRWLDANSEYSVAPDWADVVKHSVSYIFTLCLSSERQWIRGYYTGDICENLALMYRKC